MIKHSTSRWHTLVFATIVVGIISGFAGMFLALLLHFIQHLAYEHTVFPIIESHSFLYVVSNAPASRRVTVLLSCGLIAGLGWWAVYRYGEPLVSIAKAIKSPRPYMPIKTTIAHVLLQIIIIALGSPLGREVAPRELAATFTCWFTNKIKLHPKESQILVACAAGAGLAAVYNVPFGGALFTLEVLLQTFHWFAIIPALTTSAIAVTISWMGLGNHTIYHMPAAQLEPSVVIWAIISGPIFGFAAYWFKKISTKAQAHAPKNWKIIPFCLLNFLMVGLFAIYFPEILGNGRSITQLGFDGNTLILGVAILALILRFLIVFTSLQAGASGGILTPSLANGALMAVIMGILWSYIWPGISISALAVIGATAFLAAAQNMPITAIVIIIEFTGINFSFFVPILFAVAGSMAMFDFCSRRF